MISHALRGIDVSVSSSCGKQLIVITLKRIKTQKTIEANNGRMQCESCDNHETARIISLVIFITWKLYGNLKNYSIHRRCLGATTERNVTGDCLVAIIDWVPFPILVSRLTSNEQIYSCILDWCCSKHSFNPFSSHSRTPPKKFDHLTHKSYDFICFCLLA